MPNKFRLIKKHTLDGFTFDSGAERDRYCELKLLLRAGEIQSLEVHPKFDLTVNGTKIGIYKPDFRYLTKTGTPVIEDVKSVATMTAVSSLKIRVFEAVCGCSVSIIGKNVPKVRKFRKIAA